MLSNFQGLNDCQRTKRRRPQLNLEILEMHITLFPNYILQPWVCNSKAQVLRSDIDQLLGAMYKYRVGMSLLRNFMINNLPSDRQMKVSALLQLQLHLSQQKSVQEALVNLEAYKPIFLYDYSPPAMLVGRLVQSPISNHQVQVISSLKHWNSVL